MQKSIQFKQHGFRVPKLKIILGLILGFCYAFIFYAFAYVIREAFRVASLTENADLWILTDSEVSFYNFVYALIAVIIGHSVCISFWFERPVGMFNGKFRIKRTNIVHEQKFLNWYFLHWFFKLSMLLGFMFPFSIFSFYPNHFYLFILIFIVLFLQTWVTLRKAFKASLKWMLFTFSVLTLIAFAFSKINIVDYKQLNQKLTSNNPFYKYNLDLVRTDYNTKNYKQSLVSRIYLVEPKNTTPETPKIVVNNNEIELDEIPKIIYNRRNLFDPKIQSKAIFSLYIHKAIKVKYVNELKSQMMYFAPIKITYAVVPSDLIYNSKFHYDYILNSKMLYNKENYNYTLQHIYNEENKMFIYQDKNGEIYFDNCLISKLNFVEELKRILIENPKIILVYNTNENLIFSEYFNTITQINMLYDELRDELAQEIFSKKFDDLSNTHRDTIREMCPKKFFEDFYVLGTLENSLLPPPPPSNHFHLCF